MKESSTLLLSALIPEIQKQKSKTLLVSNLERVYKTALVLNIFSRLAGEVTDGAKGLPEYVRNTGKTYLRYRRLPRREFEFTIVTEQNGKLVEGLQSTVYRDVPREQ